MENKTYMHVETGSIDTMDGWVASYETEELTARGLTAKGAFNDDINHTLFEVDPA